MISQDLKYDVLNAATAEQERASEKYGKQFCSELEALGCIVEEETEVKNALRLSVDNLERVKANIMAKTTNEKMKMAAVVSSEEELINLACETIQLIGVLQKYKGSF